MYITQSFYVYTNRSYYIDCVASTFMEYFPLRPYCGTTLSGHSLPLSSSPMTLPLTLLQPQGPPAFLAPCQACSYLQAFALTVPSVWNILPQISSWVVPSLPWDLKEAFLTTLSKERPPIIF